MMESRGLYRGQNTSVQQFVGRLNELNHFLLFFAEEYRKQLDQNEIVEILDQVKTVDPECHEVKVNDNVHILRFPMKILCLI
jgi:hypothetical protein